MPMNGTKNVQADSHAKIGRSSAYGHKLRAPLEEYITQSNSGLYSQGESFLQSSSNIRGLALSHQNY